MAMIELSLLGDPDMELTGAEACKNVMSSLGLFFYALPFGIGLELLLAPDAVCASSRNLVQDDSVSFNVRRGPQS